MLHWLCVYSWLRNCMRTKTKICSVEIFLKGTLHAVLFPFCLIFLRVPLSPFRCFCVTFSSNYFFSFSSSRPAQAKRFAVDPGAGRRQQPGDPQHEASAGRVAGQFVDLIVASLRRPGPQLGGRVGLSPPRKIFAPFGTMYQT